MSNNNSITGVTGNTNIPQQQHAAAGSSATTNRMKSFIKNNKFLVGALALVAIYTVITVFVSSDMGLGGLLVFLFLLRYAHKQYEKNSKPTMSSLIGHLITATITMAIIASPPAQKLLEGFNWATEKAGEVNMTAMLEGGCPDSMTVSDNDKPDLLLRIGCTQRIVHAEGMAPQFVALDERFVGSINAYVDIRYIARNVLLLTPKKDSFPAGLNECPVAILNKTEAAAIQAAAKKKQAPNPLFESDFRP